MGKMYQYVVAQLRLAKPVLQSNFEVMPSSLFLVATRAFVKVLLALARTYELALQVNRESSPEQLVKAYKKVLHLFGNIPSAKSLRQHQAASLRSFPPPTSNRDLFFCRGAAPPKA